MERNEAGGAGRENKNPQKFLGLLGVLVFGFVLVEANYGGETACLVILSIRVKNRTLS